MVHLQTEREFQRAVIDFMRLRGWLIFHDHDSRRNNPGFPDLVMVHPFHGIVYSELKTMKGKLRPDQKVWLAQLCAHDNDQSHTYVWRPSDWDEIERVAQGDFT